MRVAFFTVSTPHAIIHLRLSYAARLNTTMVLLTMTPAIVAAVERYHSLPNEVKQIIEGESSLLDPASGKPISHGQLVEISKRLRGYCDDFCSDPSHSPSPSYHLSDLLRGSRIYVEPPKPKAEPVGRIFSVTSSIALMISHRAPNIRL